MRRHIGMACLVCCVAAALPAWPADRLVPSTYSTIVAALGAAQPGDHIVITGQHVENGLVIIGTNNLTITSGATRADLRETQFLVSSQGVVFQSLDINGNSVTGQRSRTAQTLVILGTSSADVTFEDCRIVNPATGTGDGGNADGDEAQHSNPGACMEIRSPGALTIRDCDFVCEDYPSSENIVNLHFFGADNAVGPVLVENSNFACERRCLDFQAGWSNVTVRGCTFRNYGTGASSAAGIYLFPDDAAPEAPITNMLIENCDFLGNGIGARGIYCRSARTENITIRNCNFTSPNMAHAIRWIGRGMGPTIDNCVIDIDTRQAIAGTGDFAGNVLYSKGDPNLFMHGFVVTNCMISGNNNAGVVFEWDVRDGIVIENNTITDTGREGIGFYEMPCSVQVRNNTVIRSGQAGVFVGTQNGGILAAVNDSSIVGNFCLDCPNGIVMRWSRGGAGDSTAPQLVRYPNNVLVARNIVLRSQGNNIIDDTAIELEQTDAQGTYRARSADIRYINNTVANAVGFNVVVNGDQNQFCNNLLLGGGGGLKDKGSPGNATFTKFGFNLRYNSPYQGIPAETIPTTDIVAFPSLAGGLFPSATADVVPNPGSPALRAGTNDGITPDYWTDIGAIQTGFTADTSVSRSGWECYR